jgi:hypothetical protein
VNGQTHGVNANALYKNNSSIPFELQGEHQGLSGEPRYGKIYIKD